MVNFFLIGSNSNFFSSQGLEGLIEDFQSNNTSMLSVQCVLKSCSCNCLRAVRDMSKRVAGAIISLFVIVLEAVV